MTNIIKDDYYPHAFVYNDLTYYWTLKMTNAQRDEAAKGPWVNTFFNILHAINPRCTKFFFLTDHKYLDPPY